MEERNEAADNDTATATDLTSETGMDRLRSLFTIRYLVIVIAQVSGIYGSKRTESEGAARGQGLFTSP